MTLMNLGGLQVSQDHVFIVDDPSLQDGHNHTWSSSLIASIVAEKVSENQISQVGGDEATASSWSISERLAVLPHVPAVSVVVVAS